MEIGVIKFAVIVICFMLSLSALINKDFVLPGRDGILLVLAMAATVLADFFLVIVHGYVVGVTVFWFAHVFYALRFGGKRVLWFMPLTLVPAVIFFFFERDLLLSSSLIYAGLFVISYGSMLHAVKSKKYPAPNNVLIFVGMTCFVFCDIFVALFNIGRVGVQGAAALSNFAVDAIWLFYVPAQICLALSSKGFGRSIATRLLD